MSPRTWPATGRIESAFSSNLESEGGVYPKNRCRSTWSCPESEDRNDSSNTLYLKTGPDRYIVMGDSN